MRRIVAIYRTFRTLLVDAVQCTENRTFATLLTLAMCTLFAAAVAGQSPSYGKNGISMMFLDARAPDQPTSYSRSQIKKLIRDASSSEDFSQLADYFDYQALRFQQKGQEQAKELERLLALPHHARSYPTQVEATRDLIRRYRTKAQECVARADAYREQVNASDQMK